MAMNFTIGAVQFQNFENWVNQVGCQKIVVSGNFLNKSCLVEKPTLNSWKMQIC